MLEDGPPRATYFLGDSRYEDVEAFMEPTLVLRSRRPGLSGKWSMEVEAGTTLDKVPPVTTTSCSVEAEHVIGGYWCSWKNSLVLFMVYEDDEDALLSTLLLLLKE